MLQMFSSSFGFEFSFFMVYGLPLILIDLLYCEGFEGATLLMQKRKTFSSSARLRETFV